MTTRRDAGFTLIEMLLALALTAIIAASALAALQMFVEFNARSLETMETQVDLERALHLLERDVVEADSLTFGVRQLTLTRADGTVTAYAFPLSGYELVRVVAANQVDMTTKLAAAQLASAAPRSTVAAACAMAPTTPARSFRAQPRSRSTRSSARGTAPPSAPTSGSATPWAAPRARPLALPLRWCSPKPTRSRRRRPRRAYCRPPMCVVMPRVSVSPRPLARGS